jgi:uncharacterized membrane-anchored protein YjiN (DUF445 family)
MVSKRRLGVISLCTTAGGFVLVEMLIFKGYARGLAWSMLAAAFEAGTVGAMADWFAVSALFREVPIPVLRRHTNIIAKNRSKIVAGITDMVQNKWLSPSVIVEHLGRFSASDALLHHLGDIRQRKKLAEILRSLLTRMAQGLDGPEVAGFLERVLKDQLGKMDLARPLGDWILRAVQRRDHEALWELLLKTLERSVRDPAARTVFAGLFRRMMGDYRQRGGFFRDLSIGVLEEVDAINIDEAVDVILKNLERFLRDAQENPRHPFRERQDAILLEFAQMLSSNDPETVGMIATLQGRLAENTEVEEYLRGVLSRFKGTVLDQLDSDASDLARLLENYLEGSLEDLRKDSSLRNRLDAWVRDTFIYLVEKHHDYIGEMVRSNLDKLEDRTLVRQIEEKVGDELQYIRLNGAIIGAAVGAVLYLLKFFLSDA